MSSPINGLVPGSSVQPTTQGPTYGDSDDYIEQTDERGNGPVAPLTDFIQQLEEYTPTVI